MLKKNPPGMNSYPDQAGREAYFLHELLKTRSGVSQPGLLIRTPGGAAGGHASTAPNQNCGQGRRNPGEALSLLTVALRLGLALGLGAAGAGRLRGRLSGTRGRLLFQNRGLHLLEVRDSPPVPGDHLRLLLGTPELAAREEVRRRDVENPGARPRFSASRS